MNGDPISIGAILREAWEKTSGAKGTINLALLIFFAVFVGIGVALFALVPGGDPPSWRVQLAQQILTALVGAPLTAGLYWIGIQRAVGAPIRAGMIFGQFDKLIPLFLLQIALTLLTMVGFMLLILPGIYLAVAYMLAIPLAAARNLGPWQALETSRRAVGRHWFAAAGLLLALMALNLLGLLALGIGIVWTGPMSIIAYGIFFRTLFGGASNDGRRTVGVDPRGVDPTKA